MKASFLFLLLLLFALPLHAQVGIGTTTPHSRALLDLQNNGDFRGLQLPQVTTAGRAAMAADLDENHTGLAVADTSTDGGFFLWGGDEWLPVMFGTGGAQLWEAGAGTVYLAEASNFVGIGTTTPSVPLDVIGKIQGQEIWAQTEGQTALFVAAAYSNMPDNTGEIATVRARGTVDVPAAVQAGDFIGSFVFNGYDGSDITDGARMTVSASEAWSPGNVGTEIAFFTTENGSGSAQERMRIGNDGHLGIGGAPDPNFVMRTYGKVRSNGINELSDIRWKQNITPLNGALDKVLALRGVSYDWRREQFPQLNFDEGRQLGFIAQEVATVVPELVSADAEGYLSVEYSHMVPLLVEALREQQQQIDVLKAERAELKQALQEQSSLDARLRVLEDRLMKAEAAMGSTDHKQAE